MSGICGIVRLDGGEVDRSALGEMLGVDSFSDAAAEQQYLAGSVAFGCEQNAELPVAEALLANAAPAGVAVAFDGRVDNRAELFSALGADSPAPDASDADLLIALYRRWGSSCAERMLGDFAFALWDARQQRLLAARDAFGVRPLYYAQLGDVIAFASDMARLLRLRCMPRRINEGMVGELLSLRFASRSETLYRDILRLPPAHLLEADSRSRRLRRYWEVPVGEPLRLSGIDEYAECFVDLLHRSVSSRMRGAGDVGVLMSGGLDSTTIASMAARIAGEEPGAPSLSSFSLVLDPDVYVDERACIAATAAHSGFPSHCLAVGQVDFPDWEAQVAATLAPPEFPLAALNRPLLELAAGAGSRVLLTGMGGDSWFGGGRYPFATLLASGQLRGGVQELRHHIATWGTRSAFRHVFASVLWPQLPVAARAYLERTRRRVPRATLVDRKFAERIDLRGRLHAGDVGGETARLDAWETLRHARSGDTPYWFEQEALTERRAGVIQRHPFYDRRLVEFAVSLPPQAKRLNGLDRQVLRHARLLPDRVLEEHSNAEFGFVVHQALRSGPVQRQLRNSQLVQRGWVSQEHVDRLLGIIRCPYTELPARAHQQLGTLWMVYAVDLWCSIVEPS